MLQRATHIMREVGRRAKSMSDYTVMLSSEVTSEAIHFVISIQKNVEVSKKMSKIQYELPYTTSVVGLK